VNILFVIEPSTATPIYRQIVDQVARAVAAGSVQPGDELPSVRAVAERHVINPMTVSKAYSLLEAQGLVERRRGLGMVIRETVPAAMDARLALLKPAIDHAAAVSRQLGLTTDEALAAMRDALAEFNSQDDAKSSPKDRS
jgi:GntR family transcriptional regulator